MATTTVTQPPPTKVEHAPIWEAPSHSVSAAKKQHRSSKDEPRRSVRIVLPDLFTTFLAQEPNISPHYRRVSQQSADWLAEECSLDASQRKKLELLDFGYFLSVMNWEAAPDRLRLTCDWGNWVFPFDDMFDDGEYRDSPETLRQYIRELFAPMESPETYDWTRPPNDIVKAHNDIWRRLRQGSPEDVQDRYVEAMRAFCEGVMEQVLRGPGSPDDPVLSVEAFLDSRRKGIGFKPMLPLMEYALGLRVPKIVFDHPALQSLVAIGTDILFIHNDILSYYKEQLEGEMNNIIVLYRRQGYSAQEAYDQAGELLKERQREWYLALARIPSWGEQIDRQVQRYIQGVQDGVIANLNWSFTTYRYFGKDKDEVRRTRRMDVLPMEYPVVGRSSKRLRVPYLENLASWAGAFLIACPISLACLLVGRALAH